MAKPRPNAPAQAGDRERIALLVESAPALIAAGITSLTLEGLSATFAAPPAPPADSKPDDAMPARHIDPLKDPSTYPGGRVPGFTREDLP